MIVGWDTQDLWTNYAFGGSYVDNGGTLGEDAESDVQTEALKAAMTEYAALQNTFGIVDKTQEEYKQMFINNQLIYTILDSTQLADLNASGVDYGICAVPGAKTGFGTQSLFGYDTCHGQSVFGKHGHCQGSSAGNQLRLCGFA